MKPIPQTSRYSHNVFSVTVVCNCAEWSLKPWEHSWGLNLAAIDGVQFKSLQSIISKVYTVKNEIALLFISSKPVYLLILSTIAETVGEEIRYDVDDHTRHLRCCLRGRRNCWSQSSHGITYTALSIPRLLTETQLIFDIHILQALLD